MDIKDCGIYCIRNVVNSKIYVGSAVSISNRFKAHKKKLKYGKHPSKHLQAAYNKYGSEAFAFEVLQYCLQEQLLKFEQEWILNTDCTDPDKGYNKRKIPNSNLGLKSSEETKTKIRLSLLGHSRNKDMVPTQEHKLKISKALKGRKHSAEHVERRIAYKRKPDRWPHGYACKCKPCMKLKSQAIRAKQKANALIENQNGH